MNKDIKGTCPAGICNGGFGCTHTQDERQEKETQFLCADSVHYDISKKFYANGYKNAIADIREMIETKMRNDPNSQMTLGLEYVLIYLPKLLDEIKP